MQPIVMFFKTPHTNPSLILKGLRVLSGLSIHKWEKHSMQVNRFQDKFLMLLSTYHISEGILKDLGDISRLG